jgi:haloalkane dehalogenase
MKILRTPDERFENLPGFSYEPHYLEIDDARVHYIDEGRGEVVLCLHGEPSWSYLYRKMVPLFLPNRRVLAMDFLGFGRSDKPGGLFIRPPSRHTDRIHRSPRPSTHQLNRA